MDIAPSRWSRIDELLSFDDNFVVAPDEFDIIPYFRANDFAYVFGDDDLSFKAYFTQRHCSFKPLALKIHMHRNICTTVESYYYLTVLEIGIKRKKQACTKVNGWLFWYKQQELLSN